MILPARPFSQYFENRYRPVKLVRASAGHVEQMQLSMARFDECFQGRYDVQSLDQDALDAFKIWRLSPGATQCVAVTTFNKDLRNMRAVVNFAIKRGHRTRQLWFEFEAEDVDPPLAWWPEELDLIFAACQAERGAIGRIERAIFFPSLAATVYSTGARINALMQARLQQLDLDRGILSLHAHTQKHRRGQEFPLHAQTVAILRVSLGCDPDRTLLFPWPYDQQCRSWPTLTRHYKRILKRAGLPFDRKHLWHCLRKTVGTQMAKEGGIEAARRQLGHSTTKVTLRYIHEAQLETPSAKQLMKEPPIQRRDPQLRLFG